MTISHISTTSPLPPSGPRTPTNPQQFQQAFQKLGSDLENGNLSAANQDFTALQQQNNPSLTPSGPIAQTFQQLGQDLKSANLPAADADYANLKQDFQSDPTHNDHQFPVHGGVGAGQGFQQSGQAPPSGDVASAQAAYNSLLQGVQQIGSGLDLTPALPSLSSNSSVSISA